MRRVLRQESGYALVMAMMFLMILTLMSLTYMTLGAVEPQIARNLEDGKHALYLAESGIEWGFTQIQGKNFNDPTLLGTGQTTGGFCGTGLTCKVLVQNMPLPGGDASTGTFTVTLRNDVGAAGCPTPPATTPPPSADQMRIGCGTSPDASAAVDSNNLVILSAIGKFGTNPNNPASRFITTVIKGVPPLGLKGALTLNGSPNVEFDALCTTPAGCAISGRDYIVADPDCCPTGAAPHLLGVMTTGGQETTTEAGFPNVGAPLRNYIAGKQQNGLGDTTGIATIDDNCISQSTCQPSEVNSPSIPAATLSTLLAAISAKIGTTTGPCVATASDLYCNGNATGGMITGSGILVVTGTFFVSGSFHWQGLIIAGDYVSVSGDLLDLRGAMILTHTAPQIPAIVPTRTAGTAFHSFGNLNLKYCSTCVAAALSKLVTVRGMLETVNP